jgi:cysteinyl-tRNA synthetase
MRLRDTLSGDLRELEPGPDGAIGIYVCGPTVYNRIHIGNARPFVVFQLMKNYLEWRGQPVTLVENITDINDKIYVAATAAGVPSAQLAREMSDAYIADTDRLGLGRPDREPRATETVAEIVALIEELIAAGHAYEADGDVYFAVRSFDGYGRLSNQRTDQLREGDDGDAGGHKRDAVDFALWKANKPGEDTWWESPWGRGRPGWHIECSAMAEAAFGPVFEIHGGGLDLVFPHHENELAQSRALGHEFARIWTHNGMLEFGGEKMSKSLGNDVSLRNVLDTWGREVVLLFFLTGHWRKPIDFTDETLQQAKAQWEGFEGAYRVANSKPQPGEWQRLVHALDDDFNTAEALSILHDWRSRGYWYLLDQGLELFGLRLPPLPGSDVGVEGLRREREEARAAKAWGRADELRGRIRELGFDVVDEPGGSRIVPL